jgi:hypothetical protein
MNLEKATNALIDACLESSADAALIKGDASLVSNLKREVTKFATSISKSLEKAKKGKALRDFMTQNGLTEPQVKRLLASAPKASSPRHPIYKKGPDAITSFLGVIDAKVKAGATQAVALEVANKQFSYTGGNAIKVATLKSLRVKAKKA